MPAVPESKTARYWIGTQSVLHMPVMFEELPAGLAWLIGQKEIGEGGFEHWQFCLAFKSPVRRSAVTRLFPHAHVEVTRSSSAENYVQKEDTRVPGSQFELGAKPLNRNSKTDWAKVWESSKKGLMDEIPADIKMKYYNAIKRIKKDHMVPPVDLDGVCGVWIYGPPGVGKSRFARDEYPFSYMKPCNKWWDGYQQQPWVILDDFDKNHKVLGHHLKIWADRYAFIGEDKGGSVSIRPNKIIITSNYSIEEIFGEDPVLCEALIRRFEIKHMT